MPTEASLKPPQSEINFQNPKTKGAKTAVRKFRLELKGKIILALSVLVLLLAAFILTLNRSSFPTGPAVPEATPTPKPVAPRPESLYASDSAVLNIEKSLRELENEIQNTDFYETGLNPPILDLNVGF